MIHKNFNYEELVARNSGYINPETQNKIRQTPLLIAGCGIGSSLAMCAVRMGFEQFILADGDTIAAHNLNRQFYDRDDVGKLKVEALKEKILKINPQAQVETVAVHLNENNIEKLVSKSGVIFDTVDFVDLPAILALHNGARKYHKPIFTALNVGFGALVWYFPVDNHVFLPDIIAPEIEKVGRGGPLAYAEVYGSFIRRLAPHLDREVLDHVALVLDMMKEGKACPAAQVAVGSFCVGSMALSMMCEMLAGNPVPAAPKIVIQSLKTYQTKIVEV